MPRMSAPGRPLTLAALLAALGLVAGRAGAEAPAVVASVKPVHSLVAAIMEGIGVPDLLVEGAASPHDYALKPSDARALGRARVVIWIGEGFERFLGKPLANLAGEAEIVTLADGDGLVVHAARTGGLWEAHADDDPAGDDGAEDDGDDGADMHLWLDPRNAQRMVAHIVVALSAEDAANAAAYAANGAALQARLAALDAELATALAPVREAPFVVFHDAYQYFERRYGLAGVGAIAVSPDRPPGPARLAAIRARIAGERVRCVFREPNFEPALVDTAIEGTAARSGVLDPEGASLAAGPELYFELMRGLAASLKTCLGAAS